jgi:hypothetical protein
LKSNPEYYTDWFKWLEARSQQLTKNPLLLMGLLSDVSVLTQKQVELWRSLGSVMHGNPFSIAAKVGSWVAGHTDPLEETRNLMDAMRKKYGEVEHVEK